MSNNPEKSSKTIPRFPTPQVTYIVQVQPLEPQVFFFILPHSKFHIPIHKNQTFFFHQNPILNPKTKQIHVQILLHHIFCFTFILVSKLLPINISKLAGRLQAALNQIQKPNGEWVSLSLRAVFCKD